MKRVKAYKIERKRYGRWLEVDMEDMFEGDVFRFVDDDGSILEVWGMEELEASGDPYMTVDEYGEETCGIKIVEPEGEDR